MPYPSILKDLNAKAIPQVYDGNNFQPDTGKRILYGPDGTTPLSVVDSKLGVRTTELETLIGEVQAAPTPNTMLARLKELETYLSTISQKDYATQATLSALNTAFGNEDFSSEITLASVLTKLTELDNKIDAISNADNMNVKQSGNTVAEQLDETDAVIEVLTFVANIESIEIYHDEATPQDFIVNGLTLTINSGGWRSLISGTPSVEVTIPVGVTCTVTRLV